MRLNCPSIARWLLVWGKTDGNGVSRARGGPAWNPLFAHMLDAAACAGVLWDRYLASSVRDRLAEAFGGGDAATARRVVMFLAALHDLGKASTCFLRQFAEDSKGEAMRRAAAQWEEQARDAGVPLAPAGRIVPRARHEHITAAFLPGLLGCPCHGCTGRSEGARHEGLHVVALLLGGHHGDVPNPDQVEAARGAASEADWGKLRQELVTELARLLEVDLGALPDLVRPERPIALPLLAGLVVIADWIASDEKYFPYRSLDEPPAQWWEEARRNASAAATRLLLDAWQPGPAAWPEVYPDTPEPRPFQAAALAALPRSGPALVLIGTGSASGKTRLAQMCALRLARTCGHHGFYLALPTHAATRQAADEAASFINAVPSPSLRANLAVVYEHAEAGDIARRLRDGGVSEVSPVTDLPPATDPTPDSGPTPGIRDASAHRVVLDPWYLRRCRGLVSTFGIGTVDQVVLASQLSLHWFLRLFGLANKTVIIDEAHAHEMFRRHLLSATVSWLADAGASVVVLSATLPAEARRSLVDAWCEGHLVRPVTDGRTGPLTVVDQRGEVRHPDPAEIPGPVKPDVDLLEDPGPAGLARRLLTEAGGRGITGVVRHGAKRAHELYEALVAEASRRGWRPGEIVLVHDDLLPREREPREARIVRLLGPGADRRVRNPARPGRLIVVGTRIDQALDIDLDRLYTDLAPVDVLLHRAGRVHRHAVNDNGRPEDLRRPRMSVLWRTGADGLPDVEPPQGYEPAADTAERAARTAEYAPYTLAATWQVLRRRQGPQGLIALRTPGDTTALIDAVYGTAPPVAPDEAMNALLARTWAAWRSRLTNETNRAEGLARRPYDGDVPLEVVKLQSGKVHGRDGTAGKYARTGSTARSHPREPGIDALVLFRQPDKSLTYDGAGTLPAKLDHPHPHPHRHRHRHRELLLNTVSLPEHWFEGDHALPDPKTWPRLNHSALYYRPHLVFTPSGTCVRGLPERVTYQQDVGVQRIG
ncbi:CRISPR-associated endonuclease Cas3'' [Streptomyces sp. NPDC057617]|uniref:CRISPR-associated endonuclease Cas3'' n=1 Tax=Streptomyces sp. NPDC057617 TaxID=3346184 RepID=UPI00367D6761